MKDAEKDAEEDAEAETAPRLRAFVDAMDPARRASLARVSGEETSSILGNTSALFGKAGDEAVAEAEAEGGAGSRRRRRGGGGGERNEVDEQVERVEKRCVVGAFGRGANVAGRAVVSRGGGDGVWRATPRRGKIGRGVRSRAKRRRMSRDRTRPASRGDENDVG